MLKAYPETGFEGFLTSSVLGTAMRLCLAKMLKMLNKLKTKFFSFQNLSMLALRERVKAVFDELVELGLCGLLGSHWADEMIRQLEPPIASLFLSELQHLQNYLGLIKVMLPIGFYILLRCVRAILIVLAELYDGT